MQICIYTYRSEHFLLLMVPWPGAVGTDACSLDRLVPGLARLLQTSASPAEVRTVWKRGLPRWPKTELVNQQGDKSQALGEVGRWKAAEMLMLSPPEGDKLGAAGFVQCDYRCHWMPSMPDLHILLRWTAFSAREEKDCFGVLPKWILGTHEGSSIWHAKLRKPDVLINKRQML